MAYVKNTWVDQAGQVRYTETTDDGYKIFTPNYENVTEIGTPVNAVNMNHIEDGISGVAIRKHNLTETFNLDEIVLGTANGKQNFYCSKTANNTNNALTDSTKWQLARLGAARNFGEIVTSSLPLTDSTLHLADGSLLSIGGYSSFVSYIANIYNSNLQTINLYRYWNSSIQKHAYLTTTSPELKDKVYDVDGGVIGYVSYLPGGYNIEFYIYADNAYYTFTRSASGDTTATIPSVSYLVPESEWQSNYLTYGECGKYVYNSSANTVRIPAVNSYFTNTTNPNNLGELTPASLPNIKGSFNHETTDGVANGAFSIGSSVAGKSSEPGGTGDHLIEFNAGNYNSIYKDSATTVNTQSIKQLVYIVVAK